MFLKDKPRTAKEQEKAERPGCLILGILRWPRDPQVLGDFALGSPKIYLFHIPKQERKTCFRQGARYLDMGTKNQF